MDEMMYQRCPSKYEWKAVGEGTDETIKQSLK